MATNYKTHTVGKVGVVTCSGPITFGLEATDLHVCIKGLLANGFAVVLDLSDVPHMDSSGIGTVFAIYTSTLNYESKVVLAGLTPHVYEVLEATKALTLMRAYPDVEHALQALSDWVNSPAPA